MLVFIDESGDPGFKLAKGSSQLFAAAMVVFPDREEAARTQTEIRAMLGTLHRRPEFKFNKCRDEVRDKFFQTLSKRQFLVRAIVVRKALIWSERLRTDDETFYNFFVKTMVKFDNQKLQGATVIVDGSGDRGFRQSLSRYLKHHATLGRIAEVKIRDSTSEPLLQLADMCVGAIARSYRTDRPNADRWRRMIASKLDDVWEFK